MRNVELWDFDNNSFFKTIKFYNYVERKKQHTL